MQVCAIEDDFTRRAIRRMHKVGMITTDARDRLLETPTPTDPHQLVGILTALLVVAIWQDDESKS